MIHQKQAFNRGFGISKVDKNIVTLVNNKQIAVVKVMPTNFKLKSKLEQNAILLEYKRFLKTLNSKIQIIVSSKKTDISKSIEKAIQVTRENPNLNEISQDYIRLLKELVQEKGAITKEFYIVIENKENTENDIMKISEYLSNCENEVVPCTKEEIIKLLRNFINKRQEIYGFNSR